MGKDERDRFSQIDPTGDEIALYHNTIYPVLKAVTFHQIASQIAYARIELHEITERDRYSITSQRDTEKAFYLSKLERDLKFEASKWGYDWYKIYQWLDRQSAERIRDLQENGKGYK